MKKAILVVIAIFVFFPQFTRAGDQRPDWITDEKLAAVQKIGIDPAKNIEVKGNYHWRYRATNKLAVGVYSCPTGSTVDVSRNIILIMAPKETPCNDLKGHNSGALKLLPDGSAEPLS